MEKSCVTCRKADAPSSCGVCGGSLCRKCRIFLAEGTFPFLAELPADLKHSIYCGACFDERVAPVKAEYDATLEAAKSVNVIYRGSKSTFRCLRKSERTTKADGLKDRDETILWLAFQAAKEGFNSITEVELTSRKVRNAGWQSSVWTGVAVPADIRSHQTEQFS
jgi:hypothetical protein